MGRNNTPCGLRQGGAVDDDAARAQPAGRSKHQRAEVEHRAAGIGIHSAQRHGAGAGIARALDQAQGAGAVVRDDRRDVHQAVGVAKIGVVDEEIRGRI